MIRSRSWEASLEGTHSLPIPEDVVARFHEQGHKRAIAVVAFEGAEVRYHAALQKWKGQYFIMFNQANQKALGVYPTDFVMVRLEEDTTEFGAPVPPELEEVFRQDPEALALFRKLTPGGCRSVIYSVAGHKDSQRRIDLALQICERLRRGITSGRDLVK